MADERAAQRQVAVRVAVDLARVLGRADHLVVQIQDRRTGSLVQCQDERRREHRDVLLGTAVVLHDDVHAQLGTGLDGELVGTVDLDVDDVLLCCHILRVEPEGLQQAHEVLLRNGAAHELVDVEFGREHLASEVHLADGDGRGKVVAHLGKDLTTLQCRRARSDCSSDVLQESRARRLQSSSDAQKVRTVEGVHGCWLLHVSVRLTFPLPVDATRSIFVRFTERFLGTKKMAIPGLVVTQKLTDLRNEVTALRDEILNQDANAGMTAATAWAFASQYGDEQGFEWRRQVGDPNRQLDAWVQVMDGLESIEHEIDNGNWVQAGATRDAVRVLLGMPQGGRRRHHKTTRKHKGRKHKKTHRRRR